MQSHDYVPGVSGWKHDKVSGEFEFNSCTLGSAANAPERQMVSVEVASWSKYDLPKNAANLVQFMEAELQKVPEEYRHAAEFEEFDAGYGDDSFSPRLFLSYARLETEEELADRLVRAKSAGTQIKFEGGVTTIAQDGVIRVRIGNLAAPEPEHGPVEQPAKPFIVVDGTTYLSEAFIKDGTVNTKIATNWSVKMQVTSDGKYVAAGVGLGSQFLTDADRFAIREPSEFEKALAVGDVAKILDLLCGQIGKAELTRNLIDEIDSIKLARFAEAGQIDATRLSVERRLSALEKRLAE